MKKISRRSFLQTAAVASAGAALAACSTPSDVASSTATSTAASSSTADSTDAPAEKVVINAWCISRHDLDYITPMIEEYNATNTSNIEVVYEPMTDNYDNNLDLAFQSNTAPDIFRLNSSLYTYYNKGMVQPLNDYLAGTEIEKNFGDAMYVDCITGIDDDVYTLAYCAVPFRLIYNKEIFKAAGLDPEAPPTTIDQMVEYATIITEKLSGDGIYGYAMNLSGAYTALFRSADAMAQRSGAFIYDYDAETYEFSNYMDVISRFKHMYENDIMFPGCESLDIDSMRVQFAAGKIGMYCSGDWEVNCYINSFPTDIDWAAAPVPTLVEGDIHPTGVSGGTGWALSSKTEHPDEAFEVFSLFYDFDFQLGYAESGYGSVVNTAVKAVAKPSDKKCAEYFLLTDNDVVKPALPHNAGAIVEGDTFWDVAAAVIYGTKSQEDAVAELNDKYNTALEDAKAAGVL